MELDFSNNKHRTLIVTFYTVLKASGPINMDTLGAIHSNKISGDFRPKLNGSVRSNRKSFEKTGPPFEVDQLSRSDRLEFWLNGSRPLFKMLWAKLYTS